MLSLILPTYRESENLESLFGALAGVVKPGDEVIVVDDDSPDRTWEKAEQMKPKYPFVRVIRRIGRRGLSSAVIEGMQAAKGDVLGVMDADLQHDPAILRQLVDAIEGGAGLAAASRYMKGGTTGEWAANRKMLSKGGTWLAEILLPVRLSDPMSGYFAMRADLFQKISSKLHPRGFKILLEIASLLPTSTPIAERPLHFRPRLHGESKMKMSVILSFGMQLVHLFFRRLRRAAWPLFILICLIIAALLIPRVVALGAIYLDSGLRNSTAETLKQISAREGWTLSDMSIVAVSDESLRIEHRLHRRGVDTVECFDVAAGGSLTPCAD